MIVMLEFEAPEGNHSIVLQNVCQMFPSPDGKAILFEMNDGKTKAIRGDYKVLMQRLRKHAYVSVS